MQCLLQIKLQRHKWILTVQLQTTNYKLFRWTYKLTWGLIVTKSWVIIITKVAIFINAWWVTGLIMSVYRLFSISITAPWRRYYNLYYEEKGTERLKNLPITGGGGTWVPHSVKCPTWFWLRSWSHRSWDQDPIWAPRWVQNLHWTFPLPLPSPSPPSAQAHVSSLAKINNIFFLRDRLENLPKGHPADGWWNIVIKSATVCLTYNAVLLNTMLHASLRLKHVFDISSLCPILPHFLKSS